MRIKAIYLLCGINILTLALIPVIAFSPESVIRVILGLPFLLVFPGYALTAALFPRKGQVGAVERAAYSMGFSVALVILAGLVLNFTPWGIRLLPTLVLLAGITLAGSLAGWLRQYRLADEEKYFISISLGLTAWKQNSHTGKALYLLLYVVILGAVGYTIYGIAYPRLTQTFTEFYLLGNSGKASDYVRQVRQGDSIEVVVGIINHEQATVSYRLKVTIDGSSAGDVGPIVLDDKQKWEMPVSFTPDKAGKNQKVEFYLYRDNDAEPISGPLRLWLNVVN